MYTCILYLYQNQCLLSRFLLVYFDVHTRVKSQHQLKIEIITLYIIHQLMSDQYTYTKSETKIEHAVDMVSQWYYLL